MFGTVIDWIIFIIIIVVLILLIKLAVDSRRIADQLQQTESSVLATSKRLDTVATYVNNVAMNANNFLSEAQPVFDYAENLICKNVSPIPGFCPAEMRNIITPSTPI